MQRASSRITYEEQLVVDIAGFSRDPLGYVLYAFPWGEEGTELENESGPRAWQREVMVEIGNKLQANADMNQWEAIQIAIASGHDVGKSALIAMLIMWAMSTFEDCRGVVTANTDTQLRTKTWPEVSKWHRLAINSHWFVLTATKMASVDQTRSDNWRIDIIPWSKDNTEAFAGLHNKGKRILIIFDESSAIYDEIWRVTEGVLMDDLTEIVWVVCGNPTRQAGRFAECFGRLKHRWWRRQIDARNVEGTNKLQIAKLVEDYGADHDEVRVRVRGEFPLQSEYQLISQAEVAAARLREIPFDHNQPIVLGLDLARSGICESVLAARCGRNARFHPWGFWRERDSVKLAGLVALYIEDMRSRGYHVHTLFGDGGGLGGPILDMLKHSGYPVREVQAGATATESKMYKDKSSECWARMRDAMPMIAIPDDPELEQQLVSRDYNFDWKTHQLKLTPKDKMLAEGLPSPDRGDALSLTYAEPIVAAFDIAIEGTRNRCLNDND